MGKFECNFFELKPVTQDMSFTDFSIFSFGGHFIHQCENICAIFKEGIIRNIDMTYMMSVNVYGV